MNQIAPIKFFSLLRWLDGRPLMEVIELYRQRILAKSLGSFDADERPSYNLVLTGRAKKNWKTADLILAALYRLLIWQSASGNQCYILANDEDQAGDDLELAKKLIQVNPILSDAVDVRQKIIERRDGRGFLEILPAGDIVGNHGRTYLFCGFDEIHGYKNWDLLEAMQLDPTRTDSLMWVTSYAGIYHKPGVPLYDLTLAGWKGEDPRLYFDWHSATQCTDPACDGLAPEEKANPSRASWLSSDYLEQQKRRLPAHKYRRLHLNLPGLPEGSAFTVEMIDDAIDTGIKVRPPLPEVDYVAFVDMSGGSSDDATLGIAHKVEGGRAALDLVTNQGQEIPFDPRAAVKRFIAVLKHYRISSVTGDRYAGETFRRDFKDLGIHYVTSEKTKHELYEQLEPRLNSGEVRLLDVPMLQQQLLGLIWKGKTIDHPSGEHDDWCNAVAGAIDLALAGSEICESCGEPIGEAGHVHIL